ncbi:MAG: hypothetical protein ACT4PM_01880 [Gemmatimonadales bacterium]
MSDEELDDRLRALARSYHEPPPTPRERMWEAIAARRAEAKVVPIEARRARRVLMLVGALAATLLLGIGIGRWVINQPPSSTGVTAVTEPTPALQLATIQYLGRAETFLTEFRTAEQDSSFISRARDLLTSTRLLLDNPALQGSEVRKLLADLELILVQIVQLGAAGRPADRELITDGLEQRRVLPRLRSEIPAGPPRLGAS